VWNSASEDGVEMVSSFGNQTHRGWILLVVTGVLIRLTFLIASGRIEPFADESNYLYLSLLWNRFDLYSDGAQFLWPPGYPYLISRCLELFGSSGVMAVKLVQVLSSAVIGSAVLWLARLVFGRSAVPIAGILWCLYLPLIAFTHLLWPETLFLALFLPGLCLLLAWGERCEADREMPQIIVAAALFLSLATLVKEVALGLLPLALILIAARSRDSRPAVRLGLVAMFVLSCSVVLMPWTLRNYEVYDRFVPAGATLGKNMYMGLNDDYRNLDYPRRMQSEIHWANSGVLGVLVGDAPEGWKSSSAVNVIDRSNENVRRGLKFVRDHTGYVLRSRVKLLADWVSPTSFFLRHYGLGRYSGLLDRPMVRRVLIGSALLLPMVVLLGSIPGLLSCIERRWIRGSLIAVVGYFLLAGSLLNASTRYRISIEPLLIVCAAGFLARIGHGSNWRSTLSPVSLGVGMILVGLWALNWLELMAFVGRIW